MGDIEAAAIYMEEAQQLGQTLSDPRQARAIISSAFSNLGVVAHSRGEIDLARAYHEQGLAGHRAVGDCWDELHALVDLRDVARSLGNVEQASTYYHQGIALGWQSGQRRAASSRLRASPAWLLRLGRPLGRFAGSLRR